MEHEEVVSGDVDCFHYVHDPDKCQAFLNMVMNLPLSKMRGFFDFWRRTLSHAVGVVSCLLERYRFRACICSGTDVAGSLEDCDSRLEMAAVKLPVHCLRPSPRRYTRVGTLIVATIYLQLIQNRYMFRSFTVLHCSHQHCVQPVASDVEVVGYL